MRHLEEDKAMSVIEKCKRKLVGFSLLELMVVVAILGVLAMVAIPRYDIFRARARQSEAKANLGVLYSLQETFRIENEKYYDGDDAKWGGAGMDNFTAGDIVGYKGGATAGAPNRTCPKNKIGFRLANCNSSRYAYFMAGAKEKTFIAIAFAKSDAGVGDERIYPGCGGGAVTTKVGDQTSTELKASICQTSEADWKTNSNPVGGGDAWCLDEQRNVENYRDIVENCP